MFSSNRQTFRLLNYLMQDDTDKDKNIFELCEWSVHFFMCALILAHPIEISSTY